MTDGMRTYQAGNLGDKAIVQQGEHLSLVINNLPPATPAFSYRGIAGVPSLTDQSRIQQRTQLVEAIYTKLTQPGINALALTGIRGVGKSTLAALVYLYTEAHLTTSSFQAPPWWLSIDTTTMFADIMGTIFQALEQPLSDLRSLSPTNQAQALFNALASAKPSRLIVLDQFENLLDWTTGKALLDRPGVDEWLDALNSQSWTSGCRLLFTSRLWPKGIHEDMSPSLQEYPVDGLTLAEGVDLLCKRGVQATVADLHKAVRACDGHALSLRLLTNLVRDSEIPLAELLADSALWDGDIVTNLLGITRKQEPRVGRSEEIQKLMEILEQGWNQRGSVVFIAGTAGMGKTTLLDDMMREKAKGIPELAQTIFVTGNCDPVIGSQNPYQPFIHTLEDLTRKDEERKSIANLLTILKQTAPDWLRMVPIFSRGLTDEDEATAIPTQRKWMLDRNDSHSTRQATLLAEQYTNTLVKIASRYLLTLIIEDAHWIDAASCDLLHHMAQKIGNQRLVVLVTYRPDFVDEKHQLHLVQKEIGGKGRAQLIELRGLTKEQIETYVRSRFGNPLHPMLADWLGNLCGGNPLFVTQYLSLLKEKKIIRREGGNYLLDGDIFKSSEEWQTSGALANTPEPEQVEDVLKLRIERLLEDEQKLLRLGSVQGDHFISTVLVQQLAKDEFDILDQLNLLVEKYSIITLYKGSEWLQSLSESYSFEHHLMQQAFYNKLSPRQRILMHHKTAGILENIWKQLRNPARELVLAIAHHYSQGKEPLLAAQYYFLAAQSSFSTGAFVETIALCKRVLDHLKQVDNQDRMQAEAIQLLLMASETRWRGKAELQGDLPLKELAEQAENAASRTGDLTLLAQTKYLRALIAVATEGRGRCIDILKEALQTIQQQGDQLSEFVITAELGHQMRGDNQAKGLAMLYQANTLYTQMIANPATQQTKQLERYFRRFQALLGLAEFDAGHFDKAEQWLNEGIIGFKQLGMLDELPRAFSFLGQLYMGTGLFEQAEKVWTEAVNLLKDEQAPNSYKGYNLALLGKLYLEWGQIAKAVEPLVKGWEETQATWHVSIVPLVRNYYAELLMHPNYKEHNLDTAQQLLATTVKEAQAAGFHRSAIAALSLQGKLALDQGFIDDALNYSTQAVQYLERLGGTLPALRTEEIWFNHYLVLQAAKRDGEALDYLKRANAVVQEKARSLQDESHRRAFLERVLVSKAILAAQKQKE